MQTAASQRESPAKQRASSVDPVEVLEVRSPKVAPIYRRPSAGLATWLRSPTALPSMQLASRVLGPGASSVVSAIMCASTLPLRRWRGRPRCDAGAACGRVGLQGRGGAARATASQLAAVACRKCCEGIALNIAWSAVGGSESRPTAARARRSGGACTPPRSVTRGSSLDCLRFGLSSTCCARIDAHALARALFAITERRTLLQVDGRLAFSVRGERADAGPRAGREPLDRNVRGCNSPGPLAGPLLHNLCRWPRRSRPRAAAAADTAAGAAVSCARRGSISCRRAGSAGPVRRAGWPSRVHAALDRQSAREPGRCHADCAVSGGRRARWRAVAAAGDGQPPAALRRPAHSDASVRYGPISPLTSRRA